MGRNKNGLDAPPLGPVTVFPLLTVEVVLWYWVTLRYNLREGWWEGIAVEWLTRTC